jgi:ABC-type phosphate transport system substrate-binding protein
MKRRTLTRALCALPLLAALAAACLPPGGEGAGAGAGAAARAQEPAKLVVIVNKSNPVNNLKLSELCGYFLFEHVNWPTGAGKVRVVMLNPGMPEREAGLRLICNMSDKEYVNHFLAKKFRGESPEEPRLRNSAADVISYVSSNPGAIGYVRLGELDASVKVVNVDDREPGAADYKLKL